MILDFKITELREALQSMLPSGLSGALEFSPEVADFAYPAEAAQMAEAVLHRQCEFIGGRNCARIAARALGHELGAIVNDPVGVPVWSHGCIGSISHTRRLCGAVVGESADFACLGFDLERLDRLSEAALKRVMRVDERAALGESQAMGSLLFSAKEAFFKAQYPIYGLQPSFHDLRLSVDAAEGRLRVLEAGGMARAVCAASAKMEFHYVRVEPYVMTLCLLSDR